MGIEANALSYSYKATYKTKNQSDIPFHSQYITDRKQQQKLVLKVLWFIISLWAGVKI